MNAKNLKSFIAFVDADKAVAKSALCALATFNRRQARLEHPKGETDNAGRFYPSGADEIAYGQVRSPSRAHPWSYMLRCRTLDHCCELFEVSREDALVVRRALVALGEERDGFTKSAYQIDGHSLRAIRTRASRMLKEAAKSRKKPKAEHRVRGAGAEKLVENVA